MSGYEVEHNIPASAADHPSSTNSGRPHHQRPDLSTFFSHLNSLDTSNTQNSHSIPTPGDVSAAFRLLASAFEVLRNEAGGDAAQVPVTAPGAGVQGSGYEGLLENLIEQLYEGAEHPPREVQGVSQEFLDSLDRVPKAKLKESDTCPICNNAFLDDKYPLVVRLPCHSSHVFDLECIAPWLKLQSTCPLCRVDLLKGKKEREKEEMEKRMKAASGGVDEEEEWDDMYA